MIGAGCINARDLEKTVNYKVIQLTPTQELEKLLVELKRRKQSLVEQNQRYNNSVADNEKQILELDKAINRIRVTP